MTLILPPLCFLYYYLFYYKINLIETYQSWCFEIQNKAEGTDSRGRYPVVGPMGVLHSENLGVYQQLTVAQSNRGPQHCLSRLVGVAVVWTSRYRVRKGAMTFWENVKLLTALDPVNI